jgi:protein-tyrosine phosphatase
MNFIRPWLAIGTYRNVRNLALLEEFSIGATLQFVEHIRHIGIASCHIPIDDGVPIEPEVLRKGVEFILHNKNEGRNVLSACGAGVSRSVAFATAALKEAENISLVEALAEIKLKHSEALPNPIVWRSVCGYYNEDPSYRLIQEAYEKKRAQKQQEDDAREAFLASLNGAVSRIRPWLWIGGCVEASSPETLAACGVGAMLHLVDMPTFEGIHAHFIDVPDAEPLQHEYLREGLDFVLSQRNAGLAVIIVCAAGKSRSVSFAIAALKAAEHIPLLEAAREVKRLHPRAFPHEELWKSLCSYFGDDVNVEEMYQALHGFSATGRLIG